MSTFVAGEESNNSVMSDDPIEFNPCSTTNETKAQRDSRATPRATCPNREETNARSTSYHPRRLRVPAKIIHRPAY